MRFVCLPFCLLIGFVSVGAQTPNAAKPETQNGFIELFNGRNLVGWYHSGNWKVEDGVITRSGKGGSLRYDAMRVPDDFELRFEWKVAAGSNSGVYYRPGQYEYQILDNQKHRDGKNPRTSAASLYFCMPPSGDETKPVGQWNQGRIICKGTVIQHWLNGKKVVDFDYTDPRYAKQVELLRQRGGNLTDRDAKLSLQDHGDPVWYRNLQMRELTANFGLDSVPVTPAIIPEDALKAEAEKLERIMRARENAKAMPQKENANAAPKIKPVQKGNAKRQNEAKKTVVKKNAPKKRARPTKVGRAVAENKATPIDRITVPTGFRVELLYSVPGDTQGSWVNLGLDNKNRVLVSDQFGGLFRFDPPATGKKLTAEAITQVPADIRAVNGMLWAFDAMYVAVNDYENKIPSGLYRLTDTDDDDQLDHVELLRELDAKRDHGVHAILPTPDGKGLFLVCGNNTKITDFEPTSPVPSVWGEDHLLPRLPDGRGFMSTTMGPGGTIYRVSRDGKEFEVFGTGFRNIFDAAINQHGDLFTYDADMEYDFNTSWYRPTRINHVVSGSEFGWRNGAGKRPAFYPDNLPAVIDIGPGSPTGTTFGYGAKFPAKYQNAMYALDWSWGKLYAVHLEQNGATYSATKEEFVTGAPLPITDVLVHPKDGAMYFTIGGRLVQSGLYRVTYVGDESTEPVEQSGELNESHQARRLLESFHGKQDPSAIAAAWPYLGHSDRFLRWAARTAIEHQPLDQWADLTLNETDAAIQLEALLALARVAGTCPQHRSDETPAVNVNMRAKLLGALYSVDVDSCSLAQRLTWMRATQIVLNRFGRPGEDVVRRWIQKADPLFPAETPEENWLLCETLAYLQSPTLASKAISLINQAPTQEEQIEYARSIRQLKAGWTPETREAYFRWFLKAANYRGGASFERFIASIRKDAVASLPDATKEAMSELLAEKPVPKSALENLGEVFVGRDQTDWKLDELAEASKSELVGRDFENGRKMFAASGCYACHRFNNQGGMTGPDLSSAGRRYSPRDLLDQIIHPSKLINEQFSSVLVLTDEGKIHTGVIVNLSGDTITLNTDLADPNQRVTIDRTTVEEMTVSKVSAMPSELLNRMTQAEIMDLVAYLLSGGDRSHEMFQ